MSHITALSAQEGHLRRVLVVDDERLARDYYRIVLEEQGYVVLEAHDGLAALERLVETPCWLIITDLQMPGMDGIELIRSVRHTGARMAIIVVSGCARSEVCQQARVDGADLVLEKPIDITTLEINVQLLHAIYSRTA